LIQYTTYWLLGYYPQQEEAMNILSYMYLQTDAIWWLKPCPHQGGVGNILFSVVFFLLLSHSVLSLIWYWPTETCNSYTSVIYSDLILIGDSSPWPNTCTMLCTMYIQNTRDLDGTHTKYLQGWSMTLLATMFFF